MFEKNAGDSGNASSAPLVSTVTGEEATSSEEATICPICLDIKREHDVFRRTPCNHFFHVACLEEWLKRKTTCPSCRAVIPDASLEGSAVSLQSTVDEIRTVAEMPDASLEGSAVSLQRTVDEIHREISLLAYRTFLRVRSGNGHFPSDLTYEEFCEILQDEERDREMLNLIARADCTELIDYFQRRNNIIVHITSLFA